MSTPDPIRTSMLTVASFALLVVFAVKCSSSNPEDRPITGMGTDNATVQASAPTTGGADHTSTTATVQETASPEQQEALARHQLLDLRIRLEHELTVVRAALNDGTLPAAKRTRYQKQAAELGSNIATLDAARNEMEMATAENTVIAHQHAAAEIADVEHWLDLYEKRDETASLRTSTYNR